MNRTHGTRHGELAAGRTPDPGGRAGRLHVPKASSPVRRARGRQAGRSAAAAALAAADGADSTCPMRARRGRASYLGARSVSHCDPGARSTALILGAAVLAAGGGAAR